MDSSSRRLSIRMKKTSKDADLFGRPTKKRKSKLESSLLRYDRESFPDRLERLKFVDNIFPKGFSWLSFSLERQIVFGEARNCFIDGQFSAVILLAVSYIEHVLSSQLREKGFSKEADRGLKSIIKCLKDQKSTLTPILGKIDYLREVRNPFAHSKPVDDNSQLIHRSLAKKKSFETILESDAREALSIMFTVSIKNAW